MAVFLAVMVMPLSFSRSMESMILSSTSWCALNVPDCCKRPSTKVVLPWSTWAMMAILRKLFFLMKYDISKYSFFGVKSAEEFRHFKWDKESK